MNEDTDYKIGDFLVFYPIYTRKPWFNVFTFKGYKDGDNSRFDYFVMAAYSPYLDGVYIKEFAPCYTMDDFLCKDWSDSKELNDTTLKLYGPRIERANKEQIEYFYQRLAIFNLTYDTEKHKVIPIDNSELLNKVDYFEQLKFKLRTFIYADSAPSDTDNPFPFH